MEWVRVPAGDRRELEVAVEGPEDALALVLHHGTPSEATKHRGLVDAARSRGLRVVAYSRPGYAESTAMPGRSVADAAADVAAILDALGHDRFITSGESGGGPHALACAALLAGRCVAAATIGGVAPYPAPGLDWLSGMGLENIEEFELSIAGEERLVPFLLREAEQLAAVDGPQVAAALGGLVGDTDKEAITGEYAESLGLSFRRAVSHGIAGWRDDDLAFVKPWGFDVADITTPVSLWQGVDDLMVPPAHAEWLAARMPAARLHLLPDEGHLSLSVHRFGEVLDEMLANA